MRKSILRFGALALMSLTSIGAFAQEFTEFKCDGNTYKIIENDPSQTDPSKAGTVKLIKWTSGNVGTARVKDSFGNDYIVTEIQGNVYNGAYGARSKDGAFLNAAPSITIGPDVTTIEANAFKEINGNATITLENPSKLTTLGECAFTPATGYSVTLSLPTEEQVPYLKLTPSATIGKGAFSGVTFPANARAELGTVTAVKEELFADSKNLKCVLFEGSNNLQTVEAGAFKGCNSIVWFGYYDNVNNAHFIPSSLRTVGASAFAGASAITEFKFSVTAKEANSVINNVGASAFEGCTWLDNAHFCNLFPATLESPAKVKVSASSAFTYGDAAFASTKLSGCYDFTARGEATFSNAFKGNVQITEVKLPNSTKTIAAGALQGCISLVKCDLPSGLETIKALAFENTNAFTSVFIPSSVEFIGEDAFSRGGSIVNNAYTYDESNLNARTITIQPKEATSATETSKVIMSYKQTGTTQQGTPIYAKTAPIAEYSKTTLFVPMGLMNSYAKVSDGDYKGYNWSGAAANFNDGTDDDPVNQSHLCTYNANTSDPIYIGIYKFTVNAGWSNRYTQGCKEAPEVTLAKINTTAPNAQNGSTSPYGETLYQKIGNVVSAKNFKLKVPQTICRPNENDANKFVWYNVTAVEKMSAIGDGAVTDLSKNVESAEVQADKIDLSSVFKDCRNLESFAFTSFEVTNANNTNNDQKPSVAVTGWAGAQAAPKEARIGDRAFENCTSLTSFTGVDNDFTYTWGRIGSQAFLNCPFTTVTIPDNVTIIAYGAFSDTGLEGTVTLPFGLIEIASYAFAHTQLTSVNIPASVEKIGAYAFDGGSEPVKNAQGITIDGKFVGVADVYVNWATAVPDDPKTTDVDETAPRIDPLAFGDATSVLCGTQPKYILRSLYTPDGSTYASAPFNDDKKFVISEAIVAKGGKYNGRIDVTLNRETNYRELNIKDENQITKFRISKPAENILVNYTRKAAVGMANPLFVPFEIEQKADANYQIAKVFDTKVDPETGKESIEYVNLKVGEKTKANVPYVFFPKEAEVTFNAVGYHATSTSTDLTSPLVTCSNAKNEYEFYGTYDEEDAGDYYVLTTGNRFAKNDGDNATPLKALRFYMTSGLKANWNYIKINVLDDEEVTAIENVKANSLNAPMFDLQGRQIAAPAKGQVYIQNGVKKLAR